MASWAALEMASKETPSWLKRCGVTLARISAEFERRSASAYCPLCMGAFLSTGLVQSGVETAKPEMSSCRHAHREGVVQCPGLTEAGLDGRVEDEGPGT